MCEQHAETLIAVTDLSLRFKVVEKCQRDMGDKIEALESAVHGNGHPPLEQTVNKLSSIVWGDEDLRIEGIVDIVPELVKKFNKAIWIAVGAVSVVSFLFDLFRDTLIKAFSP